MHDHLSGHRFLIDTGAEVSVLPATSSDKRFVDYRVIISLSPKRNPFKFTEQNHWYSNLVDANINRTNRPFTLADVSRPGIDGTERKKTTRQLHTSNHAARKIRIKYGCPSHYRMSDYHISLRISSNSHALIL